MVYGSSLAVYSTVEALIRCGLPPSHLSLVHSSPAPSLNNPTVDQRVWSALQEVGVVSHEGLSLQGYGSNEQEELTAVSFVGADGRTLQLECKVWSAPHIAGTVGSTGGNFCLTLFSPSLPGTDLFG